jgi:hypothetical protein
MHIKLEKQEASEKRSVALRTGQNVRESESPAVHEAGEAGVQRHKMYFLLPV